MKINRSQRSAARSKPDATTILIVDDKADDHMMAQEALGECRPANHIEFVLVELPGVAGPREKRP